MILRLVRHATDRWAEYWVDQVADHWQTNPDELNPPSVTIQLAEGEKGFIGDVQVFSWYLKGPVRSSIVTSALMALEKHIYDRMDAGDVVVPLIERLLVESNSLAIVGLLNAIGRRHPHLLRGPLRAPSDGPKQYHRSDKEAVSGEWSMELVPGLSRLSESQREEYAAWHQLEHRRTNLKDWAVALFLNDPELQPMFEEAREQWIAELGEGGLYAGWPSMKTLVAKFDREQLLNT